jgi:hypothetical protein
LFPSGTTGWERRTAAATTYQKREIKGELPLPVGDGKHFSREAWAAVAQKRTWVDCSFDDTVEELKAED